VFGYLAQCRCDPANTPDYFDALYELVQAMQQVGDIPPESVQSFIFEERERDRFTHADFSRAVGALGFGEDNDLRLEFDAETDDIFIQQAWRDALRRAWRDPLKGEEKRREVNAAFKMVAMSRGSKEMMKAWATNDAVSSMSPERAYQLLGVSSQVDEDTLIAVFNMQASDAGINLAAMTDEPVDDGEPWPGRPAS
jgi:ubiquitin carboxyl-terminal hydrolase 25/28